MALSSGKHVLHLIGDTQLRRLASGSQADVWVSGSPAAADRVLKQYRDRPGVLAALERERCALEDLKRVADGANVQGWTVRVPQVLGMSHQPPALLMSRTNGQTVDALLRVGWVPPVDLARAVAEVLQRFWHLVRAPLGDVNLGNVLCDPLQREFSIIDPGMPDPFFELDEQPRDFYPASRDLGYLLHEVLSTNVRIGLWSSSYARARKRFVDDLLRTIISTAPAPAAFVNEVAACATAHLERIGSGRVLRRAWRHVVRRRARTALDRQLDDLRLLTTCA